MIRNKFTQLFVLLLAAIMLLTSCAASAAGRKNSRPTPVPEEEPRKAAQELADYIFEHGELPDNFITKRDAEALRWDSRMNYVSDVAPGKSIGGDRFGNYEERLPVVQGRKYFEADCYYKGGKRNGYRIIYSNDRHVWYSPDHYNTFIELFPTKTIQNSELTIAAKIAPSGGGRKMKRTLKIIALAGALALCLLLTGCYQPPDEVNNGGPTGGQTASLFDTLPPTATVTVTPDTVVVQQNTNVGPDYGQPATPTPTQPQSGNSGWDNWGTSSTPTPSPSPGLGEVIIFGETPVPSDGTVTDNTQPTIGVVTDVPATPTPTQAPVTPTPTPKSLQRGFTGSEAVREVQRRLKELGYYKGSADGDFGPATESAVKEFQKANGLTADGKVGEKTLAKMNAKTAVSYKDAHATATPKATAKATNKPTNKPTSKPTNKPTATPNLEKDYYLTIGSKGKKVETLQRRLIELGWMSGSVSGTYDERTAAAVSAFQSKTKDLWEDGIAGPDTLRALYSNSAARGSITASVNPNTLEYGSEGSEVTKLQQKLKELGYLSGTVDGKFGAATEAAVIAFQKNNNLTVDGKAGTATQNKLYSGTAKKSTGTQAKIDNNSSNSSGRDTSDISSTGYITLERDSKGDQVKTLQKRLKELGFYNGSVDGSYGEGTEVAVMAFQLMNNLTVDGKAGPATQRVLYGSKANITYSSMRQGEEGNSVKNLQYTLYELGYYDGAIDGKYGQTTADAVRAFQIQNKITPVDGVAGTQTLSRMYSSDAISATAANVNYSTVSYGMKGEEVVEVQDCLVQMGYLEEVTGEYDNATVEAVKEFQRSNGLTADGKCGEKTLLILFGY